jgi:protein arginine kinase
LQVFQSGLQLRAAHQLANAVDDLLSRGLDFAFSPQLGYLTACPTNVGTGLRASVMLHIPALVLTRHIEKVFQAVSKLNLAVRGLHGEGTEASGHFYQISNQVTLGRNDSDILANIEQVVPTIVNYERKAREELLKRDRLRMEDRVWRAYGMLRTARIISSEESLMLLSALRMGLHLGILPGIDLKTINELFLNTQPGHLQKLAAHEMDTLERDARRAEYIRQKLNGKS